MASGCCGNSPLQRLRWTQWVSGQGESCQAHLTSKHGSRSSVACAPPSCCWRRSPQSAWTTTVSTCGRWQPGSDRSVGTWCTKLTFTWGRSSSNAFGVDWTPHRNMALRRRHRGTQSSRKRSRKMHTGAAKWWRPALWGSRKPNRWRPQSPSPRHVGGHCRHSRQSHPRAGRRRNARRRRSRTNHNMMGNSLRTTGGALRCASCGMLASVASPTNPKACVARGARISAQAVLARTWCRSAPSQSDRGSRSPEVHLPQAPGTCHQVHCPTGTDRGPALEGSQGQCGRQNRPSLPRRRAGRKRGMTCWCLFVAPVAPRLIMTWSMDSVSYGFFLAIVHSLRILI